MSNGDFDRWKELGEDIGELKTNVQRILDALEPLTEKVSEMEKRGLIHRIVTAILLVVVAAVHTGKDGIRVMISFLRGIW